MVDCEFRVEKAKAEEADEIVDFILDNFMLNEPLSVAVGLTRAECEKEFKEFTKSCLKDGICLVVRDPRNGEKMVALLMAFILKRNENREENVDKSEENAKEGMFIGNEGDKTNSKWHQIMQILSYVESKIWDFVPKEMECLLDFFVLSVNSEYGQRGIAGQLIEHPLLLEEAKQRGCQGIITDASNHKSQKLFAKHGYSSRVYELPLSSWKDQNGKEIFKCKCGTDRITLDFRKF